MCGKQQQEIRTTRKYKNQNESPASQKRIAFLALSKKGVAALDTTHTHHTQSGWRRAQLAFDTPLGSY
jgi:hypothetical protein